MDPVNPAPAGNPQLTTHLLVSHKKNKNFRPCNVKLKETARRLICCDAAPLIQDFMTVSVGPEPSSRPESRIILRQSMIKLDNKLLPFGYGIRLTLSEPVVEYNFANMEVVTSNSNLHLDVQLDVLEWFSNKVLVTWTTKKLSQEEKLQYSKILKHSTVCKIVGTALPIRIQLDFHAMQLQIGKEPPIEVRNTISFREDFNPSTYLFLAHKEFLRSEDVNFGHIIYILRVNLRSLTQIHFEILDRQLASLNSWLADNCHPPQHNQGRQRQILEERIWQVLNRLKFYIEPFICALVKPYITSGMNQDTLKVCEKLITYFERIEMILEDITNMDLSFLRLISHTCWTEMLCHIMSSDQAFYAEHLDRLLQQEDPEWIEHLSRPYQTTHGYFINLVNGLLPKTKHIAKSSPMDHHFTTKDVYSTRFRIWVDDAKLHFKRTDRFGPVDKVDISRKNVNEV